MTQTTGCDQTGVTDKEGRKIRLAGRSCITLFVVFLICLFSFGKSPTSKVSGMGGSRFNLDPISCLGICVGVYAFFFMIVNLRRVLRLPMVRKVLGLIGGIGLIAHVVLAFFAPLEYGSGSVAQVAAIGSPPLAMMGAEQWVVDGKTYSIACSYCHLVPEGLQYTIEYPYQFNEPLEQMNKQKALAAVFPLMKYAYLNRMFKRTTVTKVGKGKQTPSRIGVALFRRQDKGTQGYRVALSLDEIEQMIKRQSSPASTPATSAAVQAR